MTAQQTVQKANRPYMGRMLFRLSGLFLNQIIRDSRLTVICIKPAMRMQGGRRGGEAFTMILQDPETIWEIVSNPDPGAGETYMAGRWEMRQGDLGAFITMMARNFQNLLAGSGNFLFSAILKKKLQPRERNLEESKKYIQRHYDLGNDLYKEFLDDGMNYSCAFFGTDKNMSLRDAQLNKIRTTFKRLGIEPGMKVLDIGCGWGEATRVAAAETGAALVNGVTLAENQLAIAAERAKSMPNPPSYFLEDYREHAARHPDFYDRIYSIGMFEHVGEDQYRNYFKAIRAQLAPGGKALVHSIMNAARSPDKLMNSPWLEKYIFPGGRIPDLPEMIDAAAAEGLKLAAAPYLQPPSDYAETLRRWRENFIANYGKLDHAKYDENFYRMWVYYLAMSEAMFDGIGCQVGQIVFEKA